MTKAKESSWPRPNLAWRRPGFIYKGCGTRYGARPENVLLCVVLSDVYQH
jgi:hypothetical protein